MLGSAWEWLVGVLAATSDGPGHVAEALKREALRKEREHRPGSQRDGSGSLFDEDDAFTSAAAAEAAEAATWLDSRWGQMRDPLAGVVPMGAAERALVECILAEDEDGDAEAEGAFLDSLLILPFPKDGSAASEEEWEDAESTSSFSTSSTFSNSSSSDGSTPPRSRQEGDGHGSGKKTGEAGGVPGKRRGHLLWGEPAKQRQVEGEEAQLPLSAWQTLGLAAASAFRFSPSQQASLPPPPPLVRDDGLPDDLSEGPAESTQAGEPAAEAHSTLGARSNVLTQSGGSVASTAAGPGTPPQSSDPTGSSGDPCPPKRTRSVRQLLDEVVCQTSKEQEQAGATSALPHAATSAADAAHGCATWQGAAPATGGCPKEREPTGSSPKSVFEGFWVKDSLLPPQRPEVRGKRTLVLDLDETLIHSVFQPYAGADFTLQVQLDQGTLDVYVIKRPGVDEFLAAMAAHYEIVVFTASVKEYADPLLDILDVNRVVSHRLFRDSCSSARCGYVKDLARLGRPLADTIIVDNSPHAYAFHPDNALPILSFYDDVTDTELRKVSPFLESLGGIPGDTRQLLTAALGADVKTLLHTRLSCIL